MRKKFITILVVFTFLNVTGLALVLSSNAYVAPEESIDFEPMVGFDDSKYGLNLDFKGGSSLKTADVVTEDIYKYWLALDDYHGYYYFDWFKLERRSELTEIWVQVNTSYWQPDPYHPGYEPVGSLNRPDPIILPEQLDYLLEQFDTNIYPTDTEYFGVPDHHNGSYAAINSQVGLPPDYYEDSEGRNVILIENVKDAAYFQGFRFYIAGFFSGTLEYYHDRNIITIDTHNWEERIGPVDTEWIPGIKVTTKPYTYEGTIAHEYQHLIHSDYIPGDDLFMNEGFSMFAEDLCGYGAPIGQINYFFATPDNSLTDWGDQEGDLNILADYGQVYLWTAYLNDHFGGPDLLSHYMEAQIGSLAGIEETVAYMGYDMTFEEIFHDWKLANLIHSDFPGGGKYNYDSIDLGDEELFIPIRLYDLFGDDPQYTDTKWPEGFMGSDFGHTVCWDEFDLFDTFLVNSYGCDYILFDNPKGGERAGFEFDGDDTKTIPTWELIEEDGEMVWYSTYFDLADLPLMTNLDLTGFSLGDQITLSFDTKYLIEETWDYGFIQVSTDGGITWTSLANEYTVSDLANGAHPTVVANVPGLSGIQLDWMSMSFSLDDYAGQEIILNFRFVSDWEFAPATWGWWVDDIAINGDIIADDQFYFQDAPLTDFLVTLVRVDYWKGKPYYTIIYEMDLNPETNYGTVRLSAFSLGSADMIAIISPTNGPADYSFTLDKHMYRPVRWRHHYCGWQFHRHSWEYDCCGWH